MIFQSHPVYDNETEIIRAGNTRCPAAVNLKYWQSRIDQAAGKTATGQSRLRIVWGQDVETTRMIVCGEWRSKYPFYRLQDGERIVDIGIPRFYVEEHIPRAELMSNDRWDNARYQWNSETLERMDVLGPCPEDGWYQTAFMIAYHDDKCCSGAEVKDGEPCLGGYRQPTESDIERIQKALRRREQASNSEVAPTPEQLESSVRICLRRVMNGEGESCESVWKTGQRRTLILGLRYDPSVIQHGKYHWTSGHSKSGTPQTKEQDANSTGNTAE
jgi:hypothetical protein